MNAKVAHQFFHAVFLQIAIAAMHLEGVIGHREAGVRDETLGHRGPFGGVVRLATSMAAAACEVMVTTAASRSFGPGAPASPGKLSATTLPRSERGRASCTSTATGVVAPATSSKRPLIPYQATRCSAPGA